MYMESSFPSRFLIVKTSSLGDIVQSLIVLNDLKRRFPQAQIDWAVDASFAPIVAAHPMISRAIPLDLKKRRNLWQGLLALRKEKYDAIFDLQGNCKSGIVTFLARGGIKVGYGIKSVREWPNILATHVRFEVSKQQNIRLFYLDLIGRFFQEFFSEGNKFFKRAIKGQNLAELFIENSLSVEMEGVRFKMDGQNKINEILNLLPQGPKIMVCPGSKWVNKQLKLSTWIDFLQQVESFCGCSFLLIWGDETEKQLCKDLAHHLKRALVVEKLPLPTWQNLMIEVDLVIAVDSGALHLCATTCTPSFSIFGPTSLHIFKPIGSQHIAVQGPCPYGRSFEKQCAFLRSCPTGACIKELKAESLFQVFQSQCGFLRL